MAIKKKAKLEETAEKNTNVAVKSGGNTRTVKQGVPLDHIEKHNANTVGMSKGLTKNMDNYESLRVDVWLTDEKDPNETYEQAFERVEKIIDHALEIAVANSLE